MKPDFSKQAKMIFLSVDESSHPYACSIAIPKHGIISRRFATKNTAYDGIDVQLGMGSLTSGEAILLRDCVRCSFLPDNDPDLEQLMDLIEFKSTDLIQKSRKIPNRERGIDRGDKWKEDKKEESE